MKKLSWAEFLDIVRIYSEKAATYLETASDSWETIKAFYERVKTETELDRLFIFAQHKVLSIQEWYELTDKVNDHIATMELEE